MKEKEEEGKEEEALEEEKDENDPKRIVATVIASLPHSPPKTGKSTMETASTSEIVSTTTVTSIAQSSLATSQLQVSETKVPSTLSTELSVTSSTTKLATLAPSPSVSVTVSSTILSPSILVSSTVLFSLALSISTSTPISSDTTMGTLPSVTPFLGSVSIFDLVSTSIGIQSSSHVPFFIASPSISTIMSVPKVKLVITKVKQKHPLKLLITRKEIEEDIDLDTEIVIPKIDFDTATIEEMRLASQLIEMKATQK